MKSKKTIVFLLVLTMSVLLLVMGCGGASNTSSQTGTQTADSGKKEISLPQGWEMKDAISAQDVGAIVGETMINFPMDSNAKAGKPACAYNVSGKDFSVIKFYAFVNGGSKEFESTKGFAVKDSVKEVTGIGDKAYICDFTTGSSIIVVQKGETVVKVDWYPKTYSKFAKEDLGKKLAGKLLENMYK